MSNPSNYLNGWEAYEAAKKKEESKSEVEFNMSIEIEPIVFQKIMYWIDKSDFEVSGLGKIIIDKERNVFRVVDAILVKQENSRSDTELDAEDITRAMFHMRDSPGNLNFWWHSHVDMSVFWSGTDIDTIKQLGENGWFVSTVFNKSREMKSSFVQNLPIRLVVDDIPTSVQSCIGADTFNKWDKQYEDNVENVSPITHYRSTPPYQWTNRSPADDEEEGLTPEEMAAPASGVSEDYDGLSAEDVGNLWTDEYTEKVAELFEKHEAGLLADEELDSEIEELEKKYEFVDPEEDDAMDLSTAIHGKVS